MEHRNSETDVEKEMEAEKVHLLSAFDLQMFAFDNVIATNRFHS